MVIAGGRFGRFGLRSALRLAGALHLFAVAGPPVAPDVAVLAADDEVPRLARSGVADVALRRGIDAREAALAQHEALAVGELDLDRAAQDEVELLLLVVVVGARVVALGDHDHVRPERRHVELATHLAEAVAVAHAVNASDRVAVALNRLADLVSHLTLLARGSRGPYARRALRDVTLVTTGCDSPGANAPTLRLHRSRRDAPRPGRLAVSRRRRRLHPARLACPRGVLPGGRGGRAGLRQDARDA